MKINAAFSEVNIEMKRTLTHKLTRRCYHRMQLSNQIFKLLFNLHYCRRPSPIDLRIIYL
jgi:hypothetical protein